jgi:acetyltransferase EpsM
MGLPPVIIYGAGGHGKVIADIIEQNQENSILGFIDDREDLWDRTFFGYRVLGGIDVLKRRENEGSSVILAVGDNALRRQLSQRIGELGYSFATAIHLSCRIGRDVEIGPGTVVMANAVINPSVKIGTHVILNTAATVDHDCIIGDFSHVSPGAHLAGNVVVEEGAHIGIGACAIPGVRIGQRSIIGAGAAVVRDVPSGVVATGVPATVAEIAQPGGGMP